MHESSRGLQSKMNEDTLSWEIKGKGSICSMKTFHARLYTQSDREKSISGSSMYRGEFTRIVVGVRKMKRLQKHRFSLLPKPLRFGIV